MDDDTSSVDESDISDQTGRTDTGPTTVRHNWQQSDRLSVMVVEAVAAATGRPTTDLPPLHGTLDADALGTLLSGQSASVTVSFQYADTAVSVSENGHIEVHVDGHPREENRR
jgi:hypothetical protein